MMISLSLSTVSYMYIYNYIYHYISISMIVQNETCMQNICIKNGLLKHISYYIILQHIIL